jgi:class 3 adenylate cyclase
MVGSYQDLLSNLAPRYRSEVMKAFDPERLRETLTLYDKAVRNLVQAQQLPDYTEAFQQAVEAQRAALAQGEAFRAMRDAFAYQTSIPSFVSVSSARAFPAQPAPDTSRAVPHIERLTGHAPPDWRDTEKSRFERAIERRRPIDLIVLAADIRDSTTLMREAIDPYGFASTLERFTERARKTTWDHGGVFDKFTGDGFLAYWSFTSRSKDSVLRKIFRAVRTLHSEFVERDVPQFRANSQNFVGTVGLAIGLDEGPTNVVAMADDPTIVGPAVVGAVRMVAVAEPKEILANVQLGEYLREAIRAGRIVDTELTRVERNTKDYERQSAYAIVFPDLILEEQ